MGQYLISLQMHSSSKSYSVINGGMVNSSSIFWQTVLSLHLKTGEWLSTWKCSLSPSSEPTANINALSHAQSLIVVPQTKITMIRIQNRLPTRTKIELRGWSVSKWSSVILGVEYRAKIKNFFSTTLAKSTKILKVISLELVSACASVEKLS